VRTLIVSDLHLGAMTRVDLLRRPELRAVLLEALQDVDRLVLLGDVLELRHGPRRDALAAARPFFEDVGRVLADRELVVSAGNHDHALVEPWLAQRAALQTPPPLGTEQRFSAQEASPMLATLAQWAAPARLTVAYPGLWVRPDVYATHGHYLDCHLTVPTMERLGIAAMGRMLGRPAEFFERAEDYEAVAAPVFAWIDAVAQQKGTGAALNGAATVKVWRALRGGGRGWSGAGGSSAGSGSAGGGPAAAAHPVRQAATVSPRGRALRNALQRRALARGFPLAVAALNRAGLGPLRPDISTAELRHAGLRGMGEVAARLDLGAAHVIFGHTHRAGPLPGDATQEWTTPSGARLLNSGCWTYDSYFLTAKPGESPYWPGGCVLVDEDGPPVLKRLLDDRGHSELAPSAS
jgi:hypothetical protein